MIKNTGNKSTIATFVIYNLPNRECGATKPHGNLSNDKKGEKEYKTFIDNIRTALAACDEVPVALIIEPEAITNLIEYKNDKKCDASVPVYKRLITYAINTLDLPYVHLYLDGGNSGMLGLDDKIRDAAEMFTDIYKEAGSPTNLRGVRFPSPTQLSQLIAMLMRTFSSRSTSEETVNGHLTSAQSPQMSMRL